MVYDAVSILKSGDVYIYIVIFTKNNITFHLLSEIMNNITCCDISVKQESADSKRTVSRRTLNYIHTG